MSSSKSQELTLQRPFHRLKVLYGPTTVCTSSSDWVQGVTDRREERIFKCVSEGKNLRGAVQRIPRGRVGGSGVSPE